MYSAHITKLVNDGAISEPFFLNWDTRHRPSLSSLLFALDVEPFVIVIRFSEGTNGMKLVKEKRIFYEKYYFSFKQCFI